MRELLVDSKTERGESGKAYCFDYFVLVDEMKVGTLDCESYGVKVVERGGAETSIPNVTTSVTRIDELIDRLTRNTVTPVSLRDVVEDWL